MKRYQSTSQNRKNNKSYKGTTIYNSVPERDDDLHFIAQQGDRCDNLAFKFYGDVSLWWFIARVNNLKTNNIPAGTELRIPITTQNAKGL
tara:strand:- start:1787 stop:2056 length:270 start_codon:yes stop_codon:yes gene_type:complete